MEIGIFCSANDHIGPVYFEKTAELGRWLAEEGHTIVCGGTNTGLMDCIARAAEERGGRVVGVVPRLLERLRRVSDHCEVVVSCEDLSDRKALMMERAELFVALPGGVGTLDEIFTVAASRSIGFHRKRVVLYNVDGFWDSLTALLDDLQAKGCIRGRWTEMIGVASSLDELKELISAAAAGR